MISKQCFEGTLRTFEAYDIIVQLLSSLWLSGLFSVFVSVRKLFCFLLGKKIGS